MMITLRRVAITALMLTAVLTACTRREGRNHNCQWPIETDAKTLQVDRPEDAHHLRDDMDLAEELAIEYVDANYGPRSGNFRSREAASQAMGSCMVSLSEQIGQTHSVRSAELNTFFGRRSLAVDLAMNLPFLGLYCVIAALLAGKLLRRYPPDENRCAALIMVSFAALACSAAAIMVGQIWSMLAENIRVGTGHLSYRVERLLWVRHKYALFAACLMLFLCAALARYRALTIRSN